MTYARVYKVLNHSGIEHRERGEDETYCYAGDGAEGDAAALKKGVEAAVDDWDEDYDCEGVDVG